MSPATPGVLSIATRTADASYVFSDDVALAASTKYWVYATNLGSFDGGSSTDTFPGGDAYISNCSGVVLFHASRKVAASRIGGGAIPNTYIDWNFKLVASPR